MEDLKMGAIKDDAGKARVDLVPPHVLLEVGDVLRFGAEKYGDENWRRGLKWRRLYGAALRHLLAWAGGEEFDHESGLSHLAHAVVNLMMLQEFERCGIGEDDR